MNHHDIRVSEPRRRTCFPNELPLSAGISDGGEGFQGHRPFQAGVEGFVHDPHSAFADLLQNAIVRDGYGAHLLPPRCTGQL